MAEAMLWIGGWASDLACWRGALEARFPGRKHRFLDAHAVLADKAVLESAAAGMPKGGVIVAWSLGSLLLHQALADGPFPEVRTLSVSPIFDFCAPGSPWPPAVLARMLRKLARSKEEVLGDFLRLMKGASELPAEAEAAWRKAALAHSFDTLAAGLEALGSLRVDAAAIPDRPGTHRFLASDADPVAPALHQLAGLPEGRAADRFAYPSGHLPFLDHPDALLAALAAPGAPAPDRIP